jgi:hydrogenase maturation protein HypF
MVDNGLTEPVIAVTLDGTGYGIDGTIWGGEWLIADLRGFRRVAWLEPLPLPGGDSGVRHPGRMAAAYLFHLFGHVIPLRFSLKLDSVEKETVCLQVEKRINMAWTSSCGRLFDAVAALAGGCVRASYEAQAAIEMEMVCKDTRESLPYDSRRGTRSVAWGCGHELPGEDIACEIVLKPLLAAVVEAVEQGQTLADIGGKFHRTVARMMGEISRLISEKTGLKRVALTGGCFQNRLLLKMAVEELRRHGLHPLLHRSVPANDGGISLGQAAVGQFVLE